MISNLQDEIIEFVLKFKKKKNYVATNLNSYFAIFEKTPGYFLIKSNFSKIYLILYYLSVIKFFLAIKNAKLNFLNKLQQNKKYNRLVISWAFKDNFDENGNYHDKFLNKDSKNHDDTLWLILCMDDELPKNIGKNILLLTKEKSKKNQFMFFLKYVFTSFKHKKIKHYFYGLNYFSAIFFEIKRIILSQFNQKIFKEILIIYEGQPFQKAIIKFFRDQNNINIVGYDHSSPPPLPLNLVHDKDSPNKLLVTGSSQTFFYSNFLDWPKEKLEVINSMRFSNESTFFYKNKIFLPYELRSKDIILKSLKHLVKNCKIDISRLETKNHPLQLKSRIHQDMIKKIEILKKNGTQINNKKEFSIFFGQTTAVINALDKGITCYHICADPIFDSYSSNLWKNINVSQLGQNLFKYSAKTKNTFLTIEDKSYKFI
tara:strand:+ start:610 stop:1896 length:1287 start_codon:yes stop_codon:yes gene_type:complete